MKASAIVTGGSGGLGVAVVDELLAAGWRVVVPGTREKELSRLPDEPRLETVRADLSDPDDASDRGGPRRGRARRSVAGRDQPGRRVRHRRPGARDAGR